VDGDTIDPDRGWHIPRRDPDAIVARLAPQPPGCPRTPPKGGCSSGRLNAAVSAEQEARSLPHLIDPHSHLGNSVGELFFHLFQKGWQPVLAKPHFLKRVFEYDALQFEDVHNKCCAEQGHFPLAFLADAIGFQIAKDAATKEPAWVSGDPKRDPLAEKVVNVWERLVAGCERLPVTKRRQPVEDLRALIDRICMRASWHGCLQRGRGWESQMCYDEHAAYIVHRPVAADIADAANQTDPAIDKTIKEGILMIPADEIAEPDSAASSGANEVLIDVMDGDDSYFKRLNECKSSAADYLDERIPEHDA
jgi:hypothetical protein